MTNPDRFDISAGSLVLARELVTELLTHFDLRPGRRLVVGVAGESGSGKSVTASSLARELQADGYQAIVLYQDDYFVRPPRSNHEFRLLDLAHVGPHEVQLSLIAEHIDAFRAGRDGVVAPLVDYPGNRFVTQRLDFGACDVLVVEGTFVLQIAGLDVRVFLEATHQDTLERRRARNRDIDSPVIAEILAIEHRLIAPQAELADMRIDRDFVMHRRT